MESDVVERLFGRSPGGSPGSGAEKALARQKPRSLTGDELWAALSYLEGFLQETAERIRRTKQGAQDGAEGLVRKYGVTEPQDQDALEQRHEWEWALFREAGKRAGREFYARCLSAAEDSEGFLEGFLEAIRESFQKLGMGIFQVELVGGFVTRNTRGPWEAIVLVDELLDGLELPKNRELVRVYEKRFLQGLLDCLSRENFYVREIGWCAGMWTCRLEAKRR
jgi:hypothetical protein